MRWVVKSLTAVHKRSGQAGFRMALILASGLSSLMLSLMVSLLYNAVSYELERIYIEQGIRLKLGGWLEADPDNVIFLMISSIVIVLCICSLALIIRGVFSVFMEERRRLVGLLSLSGATPRQIFLMLTGASLCICLLPILFGTIFGAALSALMFHILDEVSKAVIPDRLILPFSYHPAVFLLSAAFSLLTVTISASLSALRYSRLMPMAAISLRTPGGYKQGRRKLRSSKLALTLSLLSFGIIYSFFNLSRLNTRITYYDRYEDSWDIVAEIENADIQEIKGLSDIRAIDDTYEAVLYRLYPMKRSLSPGELSAEVKKAGLLQEAEPEKVELRDGDYVVNAPVLVLDDRSFLSYAREVGAGDSLDGIIIVNTIRDAREKNFRQRSYLCYLDEASAAGSVRLSSGSMADGNADISSSKASSGLQASDTTLVEAGAEKSELSLAEIGSEESAAPLAATSPKDSSLSFKLIGYAKELPRLKLDFWSDDYYELVHVVPASLWEKALTSKGMSEDIMPNAGLTTLNYISSHEELRNDAISDGEKLSYIRQTEAQIRNILTEGGYDFTIENRIQDRLSSDAALDILRGIASVFCILLALIGLANVCTLTLSYTYKRRNICARLLAIGMTPKQLHRSFYKEALGIIGPPVLLTIFIVPAFTFMMMKASYMDSGYGLSVIPVLPLLVFAAVMGAVVFLSYRSSISIILSGDLSEELKML